MNRTRMQALIAAYGADPARWPPAEAAAAEASAVADESLRAELDEARLLDDALACMPAPSLPESLAARILQQAPTAAGIARPAAEAMPKAEPSHAATRRPRRRFGWRELWSELGGLRLAGPAFACALSMGLGLSWLLPTQSLDAPSASDLDTYLALAWLDGAFDEELP